MGLSQICVCCVHQGISITLQDIWRDRLASKYALATQTLEPTLKRKSTPKISCMNFVDRMPTSRRIFCKQLYKKLRGCKFCLTLFASPFSSSTYISKGF